jgi:hypothetical protein
MMGRTWASGTQNYFLFFLVKRNVNISLRCFRLQEWHTAHNSSKVFDEKRSINVSSPRSQRDNLLILSDGFGHEKTAQFRYCPD